METWTRSFALVTNLVNVVTGLAAGGLRDQGYHCTKQKENNKSNSYLIIEKFNEVEDFDKGFIVTK